MTKLTKVQTRIIDLTVAQAAFNRGQEMFDADIELEHCEPGPETHGWLYAHKRAHAAASAGLYHPADGEWR